MSLFGGNKLHVAILMDYAHGQKRRVEEIRRSKLLQDNHVFTCDMFAGKAEADLEDVIGWRNYLALVNACYQLEAKKALTDTEEVNKRVISKVEERFRTMPPDTPEFDHYAPAEYLFENRDVALKQLPEMDAALDRFETIFKQFNATVPNEVARG